MRNIDFAFRYLALDGPLDLERIRQQAQQALRHGRGPGGLPRHRLRPRLERARLSSPRSEQASLIRTSWRGRYYLDGKSRDPWRSARRSAYMTGRPASRSADGGSRCDRRFWPYRGHPPDAGILRRRGGPSRAGRGAGGGRHRVAIAAFLHSLHEAAPRRVRLPRSRRDEAGGCASPSWRALRVIGITAALYLWGIPLAGHARRPAGARGLGGEPRARRRPTSSPRPTSCARIRAASARSTRSWPA